MHIFISHAHEDRREAEKIHFALIGAGHTTFYDRDSLPAGGEFHQRIQSEIERCDAFIFLISPDSVARGGYSMSELKQARARWPHPRDRVLPVVCRAVPQDQIPQYLMEVTLVEPEGNLAADVLFAVSRLPPADSGRGHAPDDDAVVKQAPPPPPAGVPVATILGTHYVHNVTVPSPQGPAPGLQISATVEVKNGAGRMVQTVAKFAYLNGPPLRANPQEVWFRDPAGIITSGTIPRPVVGNAETLADQLIPMPYYALNFAPMQGMGNYSLAYVVMVFVDQVLTAQSMPQAFAFRW